MARLLKIIEKYPLPITAPASEKKSDNKDIGKVETPKEGNEKAQARLERRKRVRARAKKLIEWRRKRAKRISEMKGKERVERRTKILQWTAVLSSVPTQQVYLYALRVYLSLKRGWTVMMMMRRRRHTERRAVQQRGKKEERGRRLFVRPLCHVMIMPT